MVGHVCDDPPSGYQAFKIKLDPRDVSTRKIPTDDDGCVLTFIHSLTIDPTNDGTRRSIVRTLAEETAKRTGRRKP